MSITKSQYLMKLKLNIYFYFSKFFIYEIIKTFSSICNIYKEKLIKLNKINILIKYTPFFPQLIVFCFLFYKIIAIIILSMFLNIYKNRGMKIWKTWSKNKKFWFIRILSYILYSKNYYFYLLADEQLWLAPFEWTWKWWNVQWK